MAELKSDSFLERENMRYQVYWLAAFLAAALPWQAGAEGVRLQRREVVAQETAQQAMERISKSRNMQVWDRLTAEEYRKMSAEERAIDKEFIRQAVPLGRLARIPRDNVRSITLHVINGMYHYNFPLSSPESVISTTGRIPGKAGVLAPNQYHHIATEYAYYSIDPNEFDRVLDVIESIHTVRRTGMRMGQYDYRMTIKIEYKDGNAIYLSNEGRNWFANHTQGTIIGLGDDLIRVDYSLRDLNILFQYIDPNMIIFGSRLGRENFYHKWEAERHLPQ